MGERYRQLSLEERCKIAEFHQTGHSLHQIAAALDRSASSVCHELKRNRGVQVVYNMRVPTLITHGRQDTVVLPAAAEMTAATIAHARLSWFDATGPQFAAADDLARRDHGAGCDHASLSTTAPSSSCR
jgi:pimeloyl-ACP methyl ester carboxylesterase